MKLAPEHCLNIVVGTINKGLFQWYVTEKEVWFLDAVDWAEGFGEEASQEESDIVDALVEGNSQPFLRTIEGFEVNKDDLKSCLDITAIDSLDRDASLPVLLVDFDQKQLVNSFYEPSGTFDQYVPDGWNGVYLGADELMHMIPEAERYWPDPGKTESTNNWHR